MLDLKNLNTQDFMSNHYRNLLYNDFLAIKKKERRNDWFVVLVPVLVLGLDGLKFSGLDELRLFVNSKIKVKLFIIFYVRI